MWRATTWRNQEYYFKRILILILLTGLFFVVSDFLYAKSARLRRIIMQKQDDSEEPLQYNRNEAYGGHELVRILIREGGRVAQDDTFLVQHVKTHLLTPPSTLPYNLESKLNNTSQFGQNLAVLRLLQNKRNGFFIECGAWDGEFLSNTLLLEKDYGWTGLLIEANPRLALPLRHKNRKAWTSSACLSITPFPQVMNLYLDLKGEIGINSLVNNSASMNKRFGLQMTPENAVQVLCIPLYTYLLALKVDIVDYLSLDVEAADFAVLQTIPFDKVIFRVIEVEVMWVVEGKEAVRAFLEKKGYVLVLDIQPDFIFVHRSIHKPLAAV